jgi:hypothetical protein
MRPRRYAESHGDEKSILNEKFLHRAGKETSRRDTISSICERDARAAHRTVPKVAWSASFVSTSQ